MRPEGTRAGLTTVKKIAWWLGKKLFKLALLLIVLAVVMQLWASLRAPDLPARAPAFELTDLGGRTVRLSDFRGRTVLLNFWASWCTPCRLEVPALSRFARANPEVVVLGIAGDDDPEAVRRAVVDLEPAYTVLFADAETLRSYDVDTFPTTVVVGPDGEVRRAYTGMLLDPHFMWAVR
jgi:thiol-disulfide isomerase/thioredoxin